MEFFRNLIDGLVPRYPLESVPNFFQRMQESIGVVLVKAYVQSFAADVSFTTQVFLVTP
jgi:hypothetical protein